MVWSLATRSWPICTSAAKPEVSNIIEANKVMLARGNREDKGIALLRYSLSIAPLAPFFQAL
jgi:hypothetical protein